MASKALYFSASENAIVPDLEDILAEISAAFVRTPADHIPFEINNSVRRIVRVVNPSARHSYDGHVQVAVRDLGKGIDFETVPPIFDVSFNSKPIDTRIRLHIAPSIIENHGG